MVRFVITASVVEGYWSHVFWQHLSLLVTGKRWNLWSMITIRMGKMTALSNLFILHYVALAIYTRSQLDTKIEELWHITFVIKIPTLVHLYMIQVPVGSVLLIELPSMYCLNQNVRTRASILQSLMVPYKENLSRGKTFAVGCKIHNSLENICGQAVFAWRL